MESKNIPEFLETPHDINIQPFEIQSNERENFNKSKQHTNKHIPGINELVELKLPYEQNPSINNKLDFSYTYVILLTLNASTGYFYFGYNLTVFNTMQENIAFLLNWGDKKSFYISIIAAIPTLGAIFGSFSSGKIASSMGRKNSFFLFDLLGIISCLISIIENTNAIIIGKLLQGFCMGGFSALVPLYVNEYIPSKITGLCGILYNIGWGLGILISFCLGLSLPEAKDSTNNWWRFMFVFPSFLCVLNIMFLIFFFRYDTPKFLLQNKKNEEAFLILRKIYDTDHDVNNFINQYESEKKEDVTYKRLCSERYSKRLIICIFLNIFQQCTMINAIGLYTNLIYLKNVDQATATFFTVMTAVAEIAGLLVTSIIIESLGRRFLFILGLLFAFIIHLSISILYYYDFSSPQRYLIIFFYFLCGISIDPVIWIYNADLLPDRGVGICTMVNWISALMMIAIFPFMVESRLELKWTFFIFSITTLVGFLFALIFMKETKGKNEAEIEQDFK